MASNILLTVIFSVFLLSSCHVSQKPILSANPESHTAANSLDWQGTYYGVLPCASCSGIETEITLKDDQTYLLTRHYLDSEKTDTAAGKFVWDGNRIKLEKNAAFRETEFFKVEEGRLRKLDINGNEIKGSLANNYLLYKNGNPQAEDKRWKLIELFGKPIEGKPDSHYLIFHSKTGKIEAKAGCNVLVFTYKIRNQFRLIINQGISTLMACHDNTEEDFVKALSQADNLTVTSTGMSLNKARMAPLARFELVK